MLTTHKDRADQFREVTSYPQRECYPPDLDRCDRPHDGPIWTEIGPRKDIGGRATSMVVDARDPDCVYLGTAGGGVWKTTDAGKTWKSAWDDSEATLIIGSLAMDPSRPNVLYAGTGEANLSADNYPGCGLYRSMDGGEKWALAAGVKDVEARLPNGNSGTILVLGVPRRIGTVAVDPSDPQHIIVGGVTHSEEETGGLFVTRNGGKDWEPATNADGGKQGAFISGLSYYCHCVVFHPTFAGVIFASVEARGPQSGIWVSRDGGKTRIQSTKGLPSGDQFGRTSIAVVPGSKTVWALAAQPGTQRLLGVFRSDDLGEHWKKCSGGGFARDGQLAYTNCIACDPDDPMVAVVGSLNLHKTTDGGKTWHRISDGKLRRFNAKYVHHDHHAVVIRGGRIYSANDGGFARSDDGGKIWATLNDGLGCSMVYGLAVAPTNSHCIAIGTQDNGIWTRGLPRPGARGIDPADAFRHPVTGDGGYICYDPQDATQLYASVQRMEIWRHSSPDGFVNVLPPPERPSVAGPGINPRRGAHAGAPPEIPDAERRRVWQCVLEVDPSPVKGRAVRRLYAGSDRVWRSGNRGRNWEAISPSFDGSIISALDIAPADPRRIYVGTTKGGFFRSSDAGTTWSGNIAGPLSPARVITRIATDPRNADAVYYTIGLVSPTCETTTPFSNRSPRIRRGEGTFIRIVDEKQIIFEFAHLYRSEDGGYSWSSGDDDLPNLPAAALAVLPGGASLVVAHDGGVAILQAGKIDISGNLPRVRITDLVLHLTSKKPGLAEGQLYVSTYGRGVWKIGLEEVRTYLAQKQVGSGQGSYRTGDP